MSTTNGPDNLQLAQVYNASFLTRSELNKKPISDVSSIIQELLNTQLSCTLRAKAYLLLGICKLLALNASNFNGYVNVVWKSMNVSQTLGAGALIELSPRKLAKKRRDTNVMAENPLLLVDIDKDWPPYKLPKLIYDQSPSSTLGDSFQSRDFLLESATINSSLSSLTDSMGSYQSNLFEDEQVSLFGTASGDTFASPNLDGHHATLTPDPSPSRKSISSPIKLFDVPSEVDPYVNLSFDDDVPGFDIEPDTLLDTTSSNGPENRTRQNNDIQKMKISRFICFTEEKLKEWYEDYEAFCERSAKKSRVTTFERLFWGPDNCIARKRARNRERRAQRLQKMHRAAGVNEPRLIEAFQPLTPVDDGEADGSEIVNPEIDVDQDSDDGYGEIDANSPLFLDGTPATPMLQMRDGADDPLRSSFFSFGHSWNNDESTSYHHRSGRSLDRHELNSVLNNLTRDFDTEHFQDLDESDAAGSDRRLLEKINNLGGTCQFGELHTSDRVEASQAFYSVLRLAHEGKINVSQTAAFDEISVQSAYRPH